MAQTVGMPTAAPALPLLSTSISFLSNYKVDNLPQLYASLTGLVRREIELCSLNRISLSPVCHI